MATNYWLDLFSGETWDEFLAHGCTVSGFRASQKKTAEKIKPGDRLLCYVVGISRFIGVLEVRSEAYYDESPIWAKDTFPVRFKVLKLVSVPFNNAIPALDLRDRLKIFERSPGGNNFGYLFQGALRKIPSGDGDILFEELTRESVYSTDRPVDSKKLYKTTAYQLNRAQTDKGEVVVPQREYEPIVEVMAGVSPTGGESTHTDIQWLLAKLGSDMGLSVWVARNDKNKQYNGRRLGDLPNSLRELPHQFVEAVQKTIELIDVLWLRKDAIVGAFEIESTTSIYSGLLRMADLISMQPNLSIPLYIVAPDDRRTKVIEEINRPTFRNLAKPMVEMCRFIAFSDLKAGLGRHQDVVRYLPPEFIWEEIAESCELDPEG